MKWRPGKRALRGSTILYTLPYRTAASRTAGSIDPLAAEWLILFRWHWVVPKCRPFRGPSSFRLMVSPALPFSIIRSKRPRLDRGGFLLRSADRVPCWEKAYSVRLALDRNNQLASATAHLTCKSPGLPLCPFAVLRKRPEVDAALLGNRRPDSGERAVRVLSFEPVGAFRRPP